VDGYKLGSMMKKKKNNEKTSTACIVPNGRKK
jgi:hypothetical protein